MLKMELQNGFKNWKKVNNWKTASKQNVKNKELWEKLDTLAKFHDVQNGNG